MNGQWQQIAPPEGFVAAFERGHFVAAGKKDGMYYEFHLFRRLENGSLELSGFGPWSSMSDALSVPRLLGWADEQIAKAG